MDIEDYILVDDEGVGSDEVVVPTTATSTQNQAASASTTTAAATTTTAVADMVPFRKWLLESSSSSSQKNKMKTRTKQKTKKKPTKEKEKEKEKDKKTAGKKKKKAGAKATREGDNNNNNNDVDEDEEEDNNDDDEDDDGGAEEEPEETDEETTKTKEGSFSMVTWTFRFRIGNQQGAVVDDNVGRWVQRWIRYRPSSTGRYVEFHVERTAHYRHGSREDSSPPIDGEPNVGEADGEEEALPRGMFPRLSWLVNAQTGRFCRLIRVKELAEELLNPAAAVSSSSSSTSSLGADDDEGGGGGGGGSSLDILANAFSSESLLVSETTTEEELLSHLRHDVVEKLTQQARSLWSLLMDAWLDLEQPNHPFSIIPIQYRNSDCRKIQLSLVGDSANAISKVRREYERTARAQDRLDIFKMTNITKMNWTRHLTGHFEAKEGRPLMVESREDLVTNFNLKGEPRFWLICTLQQTHIIWPSQEADHDEKFFKSSNEVFLSQCTYIYSEMVKRYPTVTQHYERILKDAFDTFDTASKGVLSQKAVQSVLEKLGMPHDEQAVANILTQLNKDKGDGTISWNEFRMLLASDVTKSANPSLNLGHLENLKMEGYLSKLGGDASKWQNKLKKKWQLRYCILDRTLGNISYYSEAAMNSNGSPNGVIYLGDCSEAQTSALHFKKGFGFEIMPKSPNGRTFVFTCETEADRKRWIDAINRTINQAASHTEADIGCVVLASAVELIYAQNIPCKTPVTTTLSIKVLYGSNIANQDVSAKSDLACTILAGGERKAKTKKTAYSSDPVWNEEFEVDLANVSELEFEIHQSDLLSKDVRVASATFFLYDLLQSGDGNHSFVLEATPQGTLHVEIAAKSVQEQQQQHSQPKIFGVHIQETAAAENRLVPLLIRSLIDEIERRDGFNEVGIYRVSGSTVAMKELKAKMDSDVEAVDLTTVADIHTLSGLLKLYFRELPEPLFPPPVYQAMMRSCQTIGVPADLCKQLEADFKSMAPTNAATIKLLFIHLRKVVDNEKTNKMNIGNMCTCFAPTLMGDGKVSTYDITGARAIVESCLFFWNQIDLSDIPLEKEDLVEATGTDAKSAATPKSGEKKKRHKTTTTTTTAAASKEKEKSATTKEEHGRRKTKRKDSSTSTEGSTSSDRGSSRRGVSPIALSTGTPTFSRSLDTSPAPSPTAATAAKIPLLPPIADGSHPATTSSSASATRNHHRDHHRDHGNDLSDNETAV